MGDKKSEEEKMFTNIKITNLGLDLINGLEKMEKEQLIEFENDTHQFYREGEKIVCINKITQRIISFISKTS